ncbi:pro-MCH [Lampris incognitus]|uniref:pro-MCH n=1 Tax=Lampris incognitus TaxID=2546036 RepID=UPI0024B58ADB|nr:pro-MCH [Lampris incognitus]
MFSVYSVVFTLVLFSEFGGQAVSLALPASNAEDVMMDQESWGSLQGEEDMAEPAVPIPLNKQPTILDSKPEEEGGNPRIILLSDVWLGGHRRRGVKPAYVRSLPLLPGSAHPPADHLLETERRQTDTNVLRCMIGRVYRPCWRS